MATLGVVEAADLSDWMTEPEAIKWSYEIVRPDGIGEWHEDGRSLEFFLEYDRGPRRWGGWQRSFLVTEVRGRAGGRRVGVVCLRIASP